MIYRSRAQRTSCVPCDTHSRRRLKYESVGERVHSSPLTSILPQVARIFPPKSTDHFDAVEVLFGGVEWGLLLRQTSLFTWFCLFIHSLDYCWITARTGSRNWMVALLACCFRAVARREEMKGGKFYCDWGRTSPVSVHTEILPEATLPLSHTCSVPAGGFPLNEEEDWLRVSPSPPSASAASVVRPLPSLRSRSSVSV